MQTIPPLTKQEQAYLESLISKLAKKSKVSETQGLIIALNKNPQRSEFDTKKLRLLLRAEKIREEDLENKRQLQETFKAERDQAQQLEQSKETLIGKKIIKAIRDGSLLGKDYPYSKLLKKMIEQRLFSEEEQVLLTEFLVEPETNSEQAEDSGDKMMVNENPKTESPITNQSDEMMARTSNAFINSDDSQIPQADGSKDLSQHNKPSTVPMPSDIGSNNHLS